jgi:hypothetical protein
MSAVATMKPGGQHAVQQTFPYVFQQDFQAGTAYFPSGVATPMNLMLGETFQSEYHREKLKDAVQSVYNGLHNDRMKEQKLLTGTANYHLPKPVLGQRVFANPSLGAGSDSSARRDGFTAPWTIVQNQIPTIQTVADTTREVHQFGDGFVGGVMKTREGFNYYTNNLRARIDQLNAMNSLAVGMPVPRGSTTRPISDSRQQGSMDKIEFFLLFQVLEDSVTEGDLSKFTFDSLKNMMAFLFSFAPSAEKEDFQDIIRSISSIRLSLEQGIAETAGEENIFQNVPYAETLTVYMEGMNEYVAEMYKNMNLSEMDRRTLSNSLIKTLGFTRLQKMSDSRQALAALRKGNERVNQVAEDADEEFGGDGGDGHFNHGAEAREDGEQGGIERQPFAGEGGDPNRDAWGAERAPGAREQEFAYFGAELADRPVMVEPLALAGVQLYGQEGSADALNAINDSIDGILPDRNAGQSRMDVLEQEIAAGNLTDFEDFAEQVATAASGLGASESDVIAGLATLDNEFPGVFNSFIAANPVAAAAAAPQPPRALPPTAAVPRAVAATPPRPPPTVARLPTLPLGVKTRDDLRALTESEVRDFGRALSAAYGGPYVSRAGTKKATQITTLINKIKMIVPGF